MKRKAKFLFKRGAKENISSAKLSPGEPAFCEDTNELYIGTSTGAIKVGAEDAALSVNGIMHDRGNITLTAEDLNIYTKSNTDNLLNTKANKHNTILTGAAQLNGYEILTTPVVDDLVQSMSNLLTTLEEKERALQGVDVNLGNQISILNTDKADKNNSAFTGTMKLNNDDVATTKKIDISIPIDTNIYTLELSTSKIQKSNNLVTIDVAIIKKDGTAFGTGALTLFTLPVGARPNTMTNISPVFGDTMWAVGQIGYGRVDTDGIVRVICPNSTYKSVKFSCAYYV